MCTFLCCCWGRKPLACRVKARQKAVAKKMRAAPEQRKSVIIDDITAGQISICHYQQIVRVPVFCRCCQ